MNTLRPSMNPPAPADFSVQVASHQDIVLETYCLQPRFNRTVPKHAHETYQLQWSSDWPCIHHYRGAWEVAPPSCLNIIHPGEVHESPLLPVRHAPIWFFTLYLPPEQLEVKRGIPFLPYHLENPALLDQINCFRLGVQNGASRLSCDSAMVQIRELLLAVSHRPESKPAKAFADKGAMERARAYLHGHWDEAIPLETLAETANMNSAYLCRRFRQTFGMPPHRYQNMIRLEQAKKMLLQGERVADVAAQTGFAHQSHLGTHFKRLVGVAPNVYARSSGKLG